MAKCIGINELSYNQQVIECVSFLLSYMCPLPSMGRLVPDPIVWLFAFFCNFVPQLFVS